jgi:hypothetical protein
MELGFAVLHPYRSPAAPRERPSEPEEPGYDEERVLGVMLVSLAGLRLVVAALCDPTFGAEATVAVILAIVGLQLLRRI